ncbi:MAG: hypothetical protein ACRDQ5_23105 [Sciscionella sp.]
MVSELREGNPVTEQAARPRVEPRLATPAKRKGARLNPRWRKVALIAHVAVSVGWLGAAYGMAVLGLAASGAEAAFRHASYELVHASDQFVMIPLSLASLITGLIVSLGTQWGLAKHYWVLAKLLGTVAAMLFAALYVSQQVKLAVSMTANDPGVDISSVGWRIVLGSAAMGLVLLTNTTLSVVKPWGRTARGRRATARRR